MRGIVWIGCIRNSPFTHILLITTSNPLGEHVPDTGVVSSGGCGRNHHSVSSRQGQPLFVSTSVTAFPCRIVLSLSVALLVLWRSFVVYVRDFNNSRSDPLFNFGHTLTVGCPEDVSIHHVVNSLSERPYSGMLILSVSRSGGCMNSLPWFLLIWVTWAPYALFSNGSASIPRDKFLYPRASGTTSSLFWASGDSRCHFIDLVPGHCHERIHFGKDQFVL